MTPAMLLRAFPFLFMFSAWGRVEMTFSVVVRLSGIAYYMHQVPEVGFHVDRHHIAEPVTVFRLTNKGRLSESWLNNKISKFSRSDDVWSKDFLTNVILVTSSDESIVHEDVHRLCKQWGTLQTYVFARNDLDALGEGPYFLHSGKLHPAYRLYPDTAGAFMVGTVPSEDPFHYKAVDASAYGEDYPTALAIPVPSRLHFPRTPEQPYAGTRIALKDIMDLSGLKTGGSSRAYTQLYEAKGNNAVIVQKLLELGFVVVGKVKTTQFADSEWPTCDWVDYHAPFNPRGDGYLTTSGSSAGSAAAVATYSWLDFALGTDTLGSIRAPATAQGIYGMRSSWGAASFDGIIPYSPWFDTVGAFARDAPSFATIARAMYGTHDGPRCSKKPTKILYLTDYWPVAHTPSQQVFENYIETLERFLGVKKTSINLEKLWQETNPLRTKRTLKDYLEHVFEWVANPDQWKGFFEDFLVEYKFTYGHQPVLNPQLQFKRDYLPTTLKPNRQEEGVQAMKVFEEWYQEHLMPPAEDGCSDTILVLPWSDGEPSYRDEYRESAQKFTGIGFFFYNIAPYTGCPELIVPAGSTTYVSRLTNQNHELPAGLGIIAGRGSDVMLADLVAELSQMDSSVSSNEGDRTDIREHKGFGQGMQQQVLKHRADRD